MGILMISAAVIGLIGGIGCTTLSSVAAVNFATDIRRDLFKRIEYFSSFGVGK